MSASIDSNLQDVVALGEPRHDWTRSEAEAIYNLPFRT